MVYRDFYIDVPEREVEKLLQQAPMGRLVTVGEDGMPHLGLFNFVASGDTVELHLARDDEQVADLRERPKALFEVDEYLATIPSYFVDPENAGVATSYHRTVVLECEGVVCDDPVVIAEQQRRLLDKHQPEGGYRPLSVDDPLYRGALARLSAVTLHVVRCRPKFKLAQNRPAEVRLGVARQLRDRGRPLDGRAAEVLEGTVQR